MRNILAHRYLDIKWEKISNFVQEGEEIINEGGIIWNDSDIGIEWPLDKVEEVILSEKDKRWGRLSTLNMRF